MCAAQSLHMVLNECEAKIRVLKVVQLSYGRNHKGFLSAIIRIYCENQNMVMEIQRVSSSVK